MTRITPEAAKAMLSGVLEFPIGGIRSTLKSALETIVEQGAELEALKLRDLSGNGFDLTPIGASK